MLRHKMTSIFNVIFWITESKLRYENGQLYVEHRQQKNPAFPDYDKQKELLSKLKEHLESFEKKFYAVANMKDL